MEASLAILGQSAKLNARQFWMALTSIGNFKWGAWGGTGPSC